MAFDVGRYRLGQLSGTEAGQRLADGWRIGVVHLDPGGGEDEETGEVLADDASAQVAEPADVQYGAVSRALVKKGFVKGRNQRRASRSSTVAKMRSVSEWNF